MPSESMSAVSSLRTFFSWRFVSACALRKRTISSCCSLERMSFSLPLLARWSSARRWRVSCSSCCSAASLLCHFLRASASSASTFANGRLDAPRERMPMSSSRPANCSITFEKSERLSFIGWAMAPNGVLSTFTQNWSARKSLSAKRSTELFPEASAFETSFVPSGPFG